MTFADTVDLVVSGALWLRASTSDLFEHDAMDAVHGNYMRTMRAARRCGWSCPHESRRDIQPHEGR